MFEKPISPAKFDRLVNHPRMRGKMLTLNIITGAFFLAAIVYIVIFASGVLPAAEDEGSPFPTWWVLIGISIAEIPAMFLVGIVLLKQAEAATSFAEAFEKGQIALIAVLAFGEAVCVYGLIGPLFGAPNTVGYCLILFGILLMAVGLVIFRPKVMTLVAAKLAEEEKEKR